MNLLPLITDNITELLVKIIEFTQTRRKILSRNVKHAHKPGFIPKDLAVDEFSSLMNQAISEHIQNQRLVFHDTENIKFGLAGSFEINPIVDRQAKQILEKDRDQYLELQIHKLAENSLNQRLAAELLSQKQGAISIFE